MSSCGMQCHRSVLRCFEKINGFAAMAAPLDLMTEKDRKLIKSAVSWNQLIVKTVQSLELDEATNLCLPVSGKKGKPR